MSRSFGRFIKDNFYKIGAGVIVLHILEGFFAREVICGRKILFAF